MSEEWKAQKALAWEAFRMRMYSTTLPPLSLLVSPTWDLGRETSHIVIGPRHDR